ncbi:response regulator transcription factor [Winogradskyella undariae]|uniref:LytR/AlgR family response regulator transcription factor n=1 Tax=Winogradskyella TaxID=286104 RepID=UPI00156B4BE8|nr:MULTISPECIES: response regulator transcription factor [Winogradskyella]NRR93424.1 response regulator transcription factor [Winogradskyella undariae]QXP79383.1 response regulator transcription factor [Winogradskyella sp. HaHa_3_26]
MHNIKNIKILIVEDEVLIADHIFEILEEESFNNLKIVHDKESAKIEMMHFLPDIILMDINLDGENSGIELSKIKNKNAALIFLTGQYDALLMSKALKTNPDAYLTKPIKRVDVLASINLAYIKKQVKTLQIKDGHDTVYVQFDHIIYVVADGNYIDIHTENKKYTLRQSLNTFSEQLSSETFVKTHRSYIVNKTKVERVSSNSIFIKDIEIPLSRTYAFHFK